MKKQIWLYSDSHFFHDNVIKYDNLPFKDSIEMNKFIVEKWNSKINKNDLVIHLGDLFVGRDVTNEVRKFLFKQLNGDVILIRGNHDKKKDEWYVNYIGVKEIVPFYNIKEYFFCHYPLTYDKFKNNQIKNTITLLKEAYDQLECKYVFHGHNHNPSILLYKNHYNCIANKHNFEPINLKEKIEELKWK